MEKRMQPESRPLSAAARFERLALVLAVVGLALTGLPQRYTQERWAEITLVLLGGIESARILHRLLAVLLLAVAIYHVLAVSYQRWVLGRHLALLPRLRDWRALLDRVLYNLGFKANAPEGRYALRIEYLVVVISVVILALTGLMLWNPIAVTSRLPGETIPTARSIHSDHALLFVVFLVLWELLVLGLWRARQQPDTAQLETPARSAEQVSRRQRLFVPLAVLMTVLVVAGLTVFLTAEQTAIPTVPRREAIVFAPQLLPESGDARVGAAVWATSRCAFCHGADAGGGVDGQPALRGSDLTLDAFYEQVRRGSETMPAFSREELPDAYVLHLWTWLSAAQ
ncbi:MAG: c-type cytochrome [Chloroflexi bacterium]|nr:c-type cytochrome [Chloroflexota bacterium]